MNRFLKMFMLLVVATSVSYGAGKVTGASVHEAPSWFIQSFLDISEDGAYRIIALMSFLESEIL